MNHRTTLISALLGMASLAAAPAFSHHSNSAFNVQKIDEVKGTVTDWQWSNPHTWLYLEADDGKGGKVKWALEGRAPGVLLRAGWTPKIIKVGEIVTVHYAPAKDGTHLGMIAQVILPDGTVLSIVPPPVE